MLQACRVCSMRRFAGLYDVPDLLHQIPDRSFMLFQRSKKFLSVYTHNVFWRRPATLRCTRNPNTPCY